MVPSISDYALIGDCRSAALVSSGGSIDWLCWPRFESPSFFAAILDRQKGGKWEISPVDNLPVKRSYLLNTNVLETRFEDDDNSVWLTDFMPVTDQPAKQKMFFPAHQIIRILECKKGRAEFKFIFKPGPEYAKRGVNMKNSKLGIRINTGQGLFLLRSSLEFKNYGESLEAYFEIKQNEKLYFSLTLSDEEPAIVPPLEIWMEKLLECTVSCWNAWSSRIKYDGLYKEHVLRSALVLKMLTFSPSGAIVASPTTSLPEYPGGSLNWDYRYCWLRDASFATRALLTLNLVDEAQAFVNWLLHATNLTRPRLTVLYDVYGRLPAKEKTLDLAGHNDSRPVRIGNAAVGQFQLDVYGEVINSAFALYSNAKALDSQTRAMLSDFGSFVLDNWQKPDSGIWEKRGEVKNYTHSLLLAWTALDRMIEFSKKGQIRLNKPERYYGARQEISKWIEKRCWNQAKESFVKFTEGQEVDASLLLLSFYGFIDHASPRMEKTFRRIKSELSSRRIFYYRNQDYKEGAFGVCSLWAAEFLAARKETLPEAKEVFEGFLSSGNDLDLFGEEIDPNTREQLGNFPLAFTHQGIINAANRITQTENN